MSDTTSQTATKRAEAYYTALPTIHRVEADGVRVFYRAAGDSNGKVGGCRGSGASLRDRAVSFMAALLTVDLVLVVAVGIQ